jgi:hypothetical protein
MLFFRAKAHDILDSRTVVPTAIEDDNFTGSGKVRHVTLHVHLTFLAIRWSGKGNETEYPRAYTLGYRLDSAALPCAVTPFEQKYDAETFVLHPILKPAKLNLKLAQFLGVLLVAHLGLQGMAGVFRIFHKAPRDCYCLRNRHALMENKRMAHAARAARFGQSALQGAFFSVTPRMIVTI